MGEILVSLVQFTTRGNPNRARTSKLARSSPSPPPASRRLSHSARTRPPRTALTLTSRHSNDTVHSPSASGSRTGTLDWSTSYQASASSGADGFYESSTASDDDSDQEPVLVRGRPAQSAGAARAPVPSPASLNGRLTSSSLPVGTVSINRVDATVTRRQKNVPDIQASSRLPTPAASAALPNLSNDLAAANPSPRTLSPVTRLRSTLAQTKTKIRPPSLRTFVTLLPTAFRLRVNVPCTRLALVLCLDIRAAVENLILGGCIILACSRLADRPEHLSEALELYIILALSLFYLILSQTLHMLSTIGSTSTLQGQPSSSVPPPSPSLAPPMQLHRRVGKERRLSLQLHLAPSKPRNLGMALLWMTEPAHYRECPDDGLLSATLFPLLVSAACLYSTRERWYTSPKTALPDNWLIEPPATLPQRPDGTEPPSPLLSLIYARQSLVQLSTLCSGILLAHVTASTWREYRCVSQDRLHHRLPHGEARRVWSYIQFGTAVSVITLALKAAFIHMDIPLWQELSFLEIGVISVFHQFALYVMIRLARRGFTLGELGMVSQIATGMFMMTFNMTSAQIWPLTTGFIKTFTLPTPLAIFQIALIPGSFLTGFLLSPLLALSRHIAQRPIRRLRFPEERKLHRRLLAAGFYLGAALVVGGMVGMWARWCLGGRDPWIWAVFWIVQGRRPWSRPALLTYWGVLGTISVAGWNRQLARIRKYRHLSQRGDQSDGTGTAAGTGTGTGGGMPAASGAPAGPAREASATGNMSGEGSDTQVPPTPTPAPSSMVDRASGAATELLDAADKHVPTLGLNARRKFFHALAVVMFVPGIAVDPAFTHLSFSAAFSLFTFAEYVRYFALYPFGAAVHVFLSEFLDHKDSGTAILSHFYLLAGCALSLWLEGSSRILEYTGVLSLGVGDAMASIVGKRVGRRRWSEASGKTIEGSAALVGSVLACALVLRALGLAETFSIWRYGVVCCMGALLEALSVQNDNLTLPLLMWSLGTLWL